MWILLAFASAAFAGLTAILAKLGIQDTDSDAATAVRTGVVLVTAWLMTALTGALGEWKNITLRSLLFLFLSGLATGGSWLCYFKALQKGSVNKVTPVDKLSTVLTMLLAAPLLGERLTWLKLGCLALIRVGTMMMQQRRPEEKKETGRSWLIYALLSTLFASLTAILGKLGVENVNSHLATTIRTAVVLVLAWAIVFARGKAPQLRGISSRSWLFLLLSGLATGGSWLCYYQALQQGPASVVVPIDKLSVLFTVLFAAVILKEKLSRTALAGLLLLTAGTLLLLLA